MTHSKRLHIALHVLAGGLLAVAAWAPARVPDLALCWLQVGTPLLACGLILALLGWLTYRPRLARPSAVLCVLTCFLVIALALGEVAFRTAGFDFRRTAQQLRQVAPFYRKPTVPTGLVYFRRPGPETWTGRVIWSCLEQLHVEPNPYTNEAPITVVYDGNGFRNEAGGADWELAVAGDSFTELGHLPFARLFTSILAEQTGLRIHNLGVSFTGPLTQLSYLEDYGLAPATRDTVIVFFEGNDLADLDREYRELQEYLKTGQRYLRGRRRQTSLLRALCELGLARTDDSPPPRLDPNAYFRSASGPVPVTLDLPLGLVSALPTNVVRGFEFFLAGYARFAKQHRVRPWLVYLPSKPTVLRGLLSFPEESGSVWQDSPVSDLPDFVKAGCGRHGIRFINLTPALVSETWRTRRLLYNALFDTHLNQRGAKVVAQELARRLGRAIRESRRERAQPPADTAAVPPRLRPAAHPSAATSG